MTPELQAVLINGTVGSGKTTVADALAESLRSDGISGAAIDLDRIGEFWPNPPDDRFNLAITLTNLRDLTTNYRDAGARVLIMAGVVESAEDRKHYAEAVGCPLSLVRLTADLELIEQRLHRRHDLDPAGLSWHLDRAGELDAILDQTAIDDLVIDVSELTPEQTADKIKTQFGLGS